MYFIKSSNKSHFELIRNCFAGTGQKANSMAPLVSVAPGKPVTNEPGCVLRGEPATAEHSQAMTASTVSPLNLASSIAQRKAATDDGDPSTPATIFLPADSVI
jgi:hypothetical protein